jgi:hypothetical protein
LGIAFIKSHFKFVKALPSSKTEEKALQKANKLIDDFRYIAQEENPIDVRKTSKILDSKDFN